MYLQNLFNLRHLTTNFIPLCGTKAVIAINYIKLHSLLRIPLNFTKKYPIYVYFCDIIRLKGIKSVDIYCFGIYSPISTATGIFSEAVVASIPYRVCRQDFFLRRKNRIPKFTASSSTKSACKYAPELNKSPIAAILS